ncbi:NADPH-dependent FMN reductase [Streptomyces yaizuensis]|uniref:NAD(P)H-dependent oxidoreductase n=1 Tax=Streptomyces yaizuensis TaxID=2989713 RepID=A0ABQ5P2Q0_9ACTN|nr:NAD(P)H-dependent oxidoreductase [Streptomyces sp. YSPA8]GLF96884.1 NAD(P)H-dependent oxidoreductase [Streptomyces sp. YSPA8]
MSTQQRGAALRFLVLSGSGRAGSLNTRLAALAAETLSGQGRPATTATVSDFAVPGYDGDVEASQGVPKGAERFREELERVDGLVVAAPEYNASMPGTVKNLIDWTSRFHPQPFNALHTLLMSASPSMSGGNRGLWALRVPLEHLGARVYPDMFSLAQAHTAFAPGGGLGDPVLQRRFGTTLDDFGSLAEAAKHYPCAKKAWVEYLGEHPDAATDRTQTG